MQAISLLLTILALSAADENADSNVTTATLVSDLQSGTRPVLLFTVFPRHILLLIGSAGTNPNLDDTYVVEQDLTTISASRDAIALKQSQKLKTRWPAFPATYLTLFAIRDNVDEYLILADNKMTQALNMATGNITTLSLSNSDDFLTNHILLMSSSGQRTFYYLNADTAILTKANFSRPNITQEGGVIARFSGPHLCSSGQASITFQRSPCTVKVDWLKAGFIDESHFVLLDHSNAVFTFLKEAYEKPSGGSVALKKTEASQFWRLWQPTTLNTTDTDEPEDMSTTEVDNHSSIGITVLVIGLITLLLLAIFVGVAYYYYQNYKRQSCSPSASGRNEKSSTAKSAVKSKKSSARRTAVGVSTILKAAPLLAQKLAAMDAKEKKNQEIRSISRSISKGRTQEAVAKDPMDSSCSQTTIKFVPKEFSSSTMKKGGPSVKRPVKMKDKMAKWRTGTVSTSGKKSSSTRQTANRSSTQRSKMKRATIVGSSTMRNRAKNRPDLMVDESSVLSKECRESSKRSIAKRSSSGQTPPSFVR